VGIPESDALGKLDTLAGQDEVRVCTGYTHNGRKVGGFPADVALLERCEPEYRSFASWPEIEDAGAGELPEEAGPYLTVMAEAAGCPVDLVSIGPGRDQLVFL
jgi:adenylosuccinate synthase